MTFDYKTKTNNLPPKFTWKRDKHLLTKHTLSQYFLHNDNLNTIFNFTDPNIIANILHFEMDLIINCIAPRHRVQVKKKYSPYVSKELMNQYNKKNDLYSQAIAKNDMDLFRQFKNERNGFYRNLKKKKLIFSIRFL